jgi:hypothetical protein
VSENLRKLIGVAVMAVLVVVGVVVSSGDDTDYTRNTAFGVPKGDGLDDQLQQPGDAENQLSLAIVAAQCEEGRVLISTGDRVEPWRCGPLLEEMATSKDLIEVSVPPEQWNSHPCTMGYWVSLSSREDRSTVLDGCLSLWSGGRHIDEVEKVLRQFTREADAHRVCPNWFRNARIDLPRDDPNSIRVSGVNIATHLSCD